MYFVIIESSYNDIDLGLWSWHTNSPEEIYQAESKYLQQFLSYCADRHTNLHTPVSKESDMHVFVIIARRSSKIRKVGETTDRQTRSAENYTSSLLRRW